MYNKVYNLWDSAKKYSTGRHGTHNNIIMRVRFVFWLDKDIGAHAEYVQLIAFPVLQ